MGNYNSWGGKNNSWGNRNRKGSSGNSGGPQRDDETWSKYAKIFAVGIAVLVFAKMGFGPVVETVENVFDFLDFGSEVTETVDNNINKDTQNGGYKSVKGKLELDESDVNDVLEYLYEKLDERNVDIENGTAVFVDYSVFKNDKNYRKNVVEKLENYSNTVSFIALNSEKLSNEEMSSEFSRISEIIENNNDIAGCGVNKYDTSGLKNNPNEGDFIFSVTFSK